MEKKIKSIGQINLTFKIAIYFSLFMSIACLISQVTESIHTVTLEKFTLFFFVITICFGVQRLNLGLDLWLEQNKKDSEN